MKPYSPDEFSYVLYDEKTIQQKVRQLGAQISADYRSMNERGQDTIVAVGLMRGALPFMADLGRAMDLSMTYELLWLSSYGSSDRPGQIELVQDLRSSIEDRHVLLLEDIIDTGHTLRFALDLFKQRKPASIRTCCLLDKLPRREVEVPVEYVGFVMEKDEFVVGYGLDYAGRYRNLPYIAALHPRMYRK